MTEDLDPVEKHDKAIEMRVRCCVKLPDTVPAALREADVDGDGSISFMEFATLMKVDRGDRLDLFDSRHRNGDQ